MEKNGNFLETGSYNGHYYGTPKPLLGDLTLDDQPKKSTAETTENNTESCERVTVHRENEDLSDKPVENGLESGSENNSRKDEIAQNQPIQV